jgi:hypothetical protein
MVGGTAATAAEAGRLGRPLLALDPAAPDAVERIGEWLRQEAIGELNVAGPRESEAPGIAAETYRLLTRLLRR